MGSSPVPMPGPTTSVFTGEETGVIKAAEAASATIIAGIAIPVISLHGLEPSAPIKVEKALLLHGLVPPCRP